MPFRDDTISISSVIEALPDEARDYADQVFAAALDAAGVLGAEHDTPEGYRDERLRRYATAVFNRGSAPDPRMFRLDPATAAKLSHFSLRIRHEYLAYLDDQRDLIGS